MGSVNRVILLGRLGADPEIRNTQSGWKFGSIRLATSENWKDKTTGEKKEETEWHQVKLSGDGLCSVAERYLRKGDQVYIEGKLKTEKWTDQSGAERYSTKIVVDTFGGKIVLIGGSGNGGGEKTVQEEYGIGSSAGSKSKDIDDEIPF